MLLILAVPGAVAAQVPPPLPGIAAAEIDPSTLSDEELLDLLNQLERGRQRRPTRVSNFGVPSGFGLPNRVGFVGLAATNKRDRRFEDDWDGSLVFGMGFGDADRAIAVTPMVDITSLTPYHIGESGKIGVTLSRNFSFGGTWQGGVALDLQNLVTWGDSNLLDPDANLAVSGIRPADEAFGLPMMLTLGYGSGIRDRGTEPGVFGGVGLGLSDRYGASLSWYGDEWIGGVAIWGLAQRNLQISLGVGDITDRISGRRLLVAVSFARAFGRAP